MGCLIGLGVRLSRVQYGVLYVTNTGITGIRLFTLFVLEALLYVLLHTPLYIYW